jgi:hypothetical protein
MTSRRSSTTELEPSTGWQLVMFGALAFVSCDPRAVQGLEHPYAPASVGDEWVYSIPQTYPGVAVPSSQSVERIVSAERRGDRLVARVRSEFTGTTFAERDLVIDAKGVTAEIGTMTSGVGDVTVKVAEGVYLPRELSAGMSWSWRQEIDTPISSMKVVGRCSVVGDGVFDGMTAVHVRCETQNQMTTMIKGAPPQAIDHVQTEDNYYVRGLGLVRSITTTPAGYRSEKVLIRWQVAGAPAKGAPAKGADTPAIAVDPGKYDRE